MRTSLSYAHSLLGELPPLRTQRILPFILLKEHCLSTVLHRTIKALLKRFSKHTAGDTHAIPVDLLDVTFRTVCSVILPHSVTRVLTNWLL